MEACDLSKGDILYELLSQRSPTLKEWELEAGYAACKTYREMAKAPSPLFLSLLFDCASGLGYNDEAVQIAWQAVTKNAETPKMLSTLCNYIHRKRSNSSYVRLLLDENTSFLEEENSQNTSTRPKNEDKGKSIEREKKKRKKNAFGFSHQRVPASSNHPKESKNGLRTFGASATSLTERSDKHRVYDGSKSLPLQNQHKRAAPAQIGFYFDYPAMCAAEDMEAEKGESSVSLCVSNWSQGRCWCDWYRLDLIKKDYKKIFGSVECGGIRVKRFSAATAGSTIYMHGCLNAYTFWAEKRQTCCNNVLYLDVDHPRDGWKEGPQLSFPHVAPVATSMNETVYIFSAEYISSGVFAMALDTSDSESGWKPLMVYPSNEIPSCLQLHFVLAIPDPLRDRILLFKRDWGIFAYYPRKQVLKDIHTELKKDHSLTSRACTVVDGVLYHSECDSDELLCAYDLDQRKELTPVFSLKVSFYPCEYWDQLLDLGGGKLCLVRDLKREVVFLRLKVQREAGGDKVHITAVSFDRFRIPKDSKFVLSVAL